jgi:uncharacterized repeat protein (TIGR03803 family)
MRNKRLIPLTALAAGVALAPIAANAGTLTTLYSFNGGSDGSSPDWLILHGAYLYGATSGGNGTVFKLKLATPKKTTLYDFQGGMDGSFPNGFSFIAGALYGTTGAGGGFGCVGGAGCGTVFAVDPKTGVETVLYRFSSSSDGGAGGFPQPGLAYEQSTLYGLTEIGGNQRACSYGCGTVFSLNLRNLDETPLYDLVPSNGYLPGYGVIKVGSTLYGTTTNGGASQDGSIFAYDIATNQESTLYSFGGAADGIQSHGQLIYKGGHLYGAMEQGGSAHCSCGTLFEYDIDRGIYSAFYSFTAGADGSFPTGPMILQNDVIYGTTEYGGGTGCGGNGCGTVFAYDLTSTTETILYQFSGGQDGATPYSLIYKSGTLYGVTEGGGAQGFGSVFKLVP